MPASAAHISFFFFSLQGVRKALQDNKREANLASKGIKKSRQRRLRLERLETRALLSADLAAFGLGGDLDAFRSIDGSGNNETYPHWGAAGEMLLRQTTIEYGDGLSTPAGSDRVSARMISNSVVAQTEPVLNDGRLSDLLWQWGQFLDHDVSLTDPADPAEPFPIAVPRGDHYFDPRGTGTQVIGLNRSEHEIDSFGIRQQTNEISAYIDGSNVYGSDEKRAAALRTFQGGRLKTSAGDLLPFNELGLPNAGGPSDDLFLAGDVRANEQVGLMAMHTLWVREHNRIADELAASDPKATDEELYQRARSIVIAEMQVITYNEFLPALLGRDAMPDYQGYDPSIDAGIANEFSTAAYRFGHSMLSPELLRLDNDGTVAAEGHLPLREAFFSPHEIVDHGIDSLLVGMAHQQAQRIDNMVIDDVRNFLFGPPGSGGFDLASLNIQRGRDHGLADYNQVRSDLGLQPVDDFDDISSDPQVQASLAAVYKTVDDIDLWVGGLAEDHVRGAAVGELVRTILVDQFTRLRDGDRFWYQAILSESELREIEQTTLCDVIERNTNITGLQRHVFLASGPRFAISHDVAIDGSVSHPATASWPGGSGEFQDSGVGLPATQFSSRAELRQDVPGIQRQAQVIHVAQQTDLDQRTAELEKSLEELRAPVEAIASLHG